MGGRDRWGLDVGDEAALRDRWTRAPDVVDGMTSSTVAPSAPSVASGGRRQPWLWRTERESRPEASWLRLAVRRACLDGGATSVWINSCSDGVSCRPRLTRTTRSISLLLSARTETCKREHREAHTTAYVDTSGGECAPPSSLNAAP